MKPNQKLIVVLAAILLTCSFAAKSQTIPLIMGGGNFTNGDVNSVIDSQFDVLNDIGIGMCRINVYPGLYWNGTTATPKSIDKIVKLCYSRGITPMILFEFYGNYGAIGSKAKWETIGKLFAERFMPNSVWLKSQNIPNWGISVYTAINEPDNENTIPKTGANSYYDALEGLADGVHSIDNSLKVNPGGFMAANAYDDWTLRGYGKAIAPLYNTGKLHGIDLHTYYDVDYATMEGNYTNSAQKNFDLVKSSCGITSDIAFYSTEFNYKKRACTEDQAALGFLTGIWDNLGVIGKNNTSVTQFAFPWCIFNTASVDDNYGLCTQLKPWTPTTRGTVLKMVSQLTTGMWFTTLTPKTNGVFILEGNNQKMWVYQNRTAWTYKLSTTFSITEIPPTATTLKVYRWNSTETSPWQTIDLTGQTAYTVSGLMKQETYMFVVNASSINVSVNDRVTTPKTNIKLCSNPSVTESVDAELLNYEQGNMILSVTDLIGKTVYSEKIEISDSFQKVHISAADLKNGTYILSAKQNNRIENVKFILNKK